MERSGTSVLYIGFMVPIWRGRYVCPIYRMHGAYLRRSGTSVLYIGCMVPIWGGAVRLSYIYNAGCLKVNVFVDRDVMGTRNRCHLGPLGV